MNKLKIRNLTYALEDIQKVISDLAKGLAEEVEYDYSEEKKEPFDEKIIDQYTYLLNEARKLMTKIKETRWENSNDVIIRWDYEE